MCRDVDDDCMQETASYISESAASFLRTVHLSLAPFLILLFIVVGFAQNWETAGCYIIIAILSGATGYIGMTITTVGEFRTTAASAQCLSSRLNVSFRVWSVMGLSVVAEGLTGLSVCYLIFRSVLSSTWFTAGASTVAL